MLILTFEPSVKWAERIKGCTVRGAPIIQSPFQKITGTLRRRWKLRHVRPGINLSRTAGPLAPFATRQRCKGSNHSIEKPEWSQQAEARNIRQYFRHLAQIMACFRRDCKSRALARVQLAPNPVVAQRVGAGFQVFAGAFTGDWAHKVA